MELEIVRPNRSAGGALYTPVIAGEPTKTHAAVLKRVLLAMKLTAIILFAACLTASAKGYSQKITLSEKNAPLEKLFTEIRKQTGYYFFYDLGDLKTTTPVTINIKNADLAQALAECFKNQPLTYTIVNATVVVKPKAAETAATANASSQENPLPPIDVQGRVTDSTGGPLAGATVAIVGKATTAITDENGRFTINAEAGDVIIISFVGFTTQRIKVTANTTDVSIALKYTTGKLEEVVTYATGYQQVPKERATGSFVFVDNQLFNRRISSDVISKLEGVVPGLLFNRNTINSANGQTDINIRGHSTLYANDQPLIILDNFPYDGNINNINPNDIENVTVLKDAAAASIWGVRSGNGVIVITTKKGRRNQKVSVGLNSNVTIGNKPDLFYSPIFLPSNDFISIEQTLFNQGYYDSQIGDPTQVISPVVQILADQRAGLISTAAATAQIDALKNIDVRNDLSKYFYQKSVNQQYALSFRGGGNRSDYFFSLGYDNNLSNYVGNKNSRYTLSSNYNFYPVKDLQFSAKINLIQGFYKSNSTLGEVQVGGNIHAIYPYAQLADANGNSLSIVKNYQSGYTDTAGGGRFLDWSYKPLDELANADNSTKTVDNRINLEIKYSFLKDFNASINYLYERSSTINDNYYNTSTYYARNLINQFTQIDPTTGSLSYPVPIGGILQQSNFYLTSQRARGQLDYSHNWNQKHDVSAIAGAEISSVISEGNSNTAYGYSNSTSNSVGTIDYSTSFPLNPVGSSKIPQSLSFGKTTDHYISYFGNAGYTYNNRYTVSLSARVDKSNLFGVSTNQKSVPLWSAGLMWDFSKEKFYHFSWLPYGKFRVTYGYNGNLNKSATAVTTVRQFTPAYFYNYPYDQIINPGNPELRWEKVRVVNLGLDYATKNDILSGSFEYYFKKGIDLFGNSPLAPSTGIFTFFGNTANTVGHGFDVTVTTKNITTKNFTWTTNLIWSHVLDKVTKYDVKLSSTQYITLSNASSIYPLEGNPVFALYSYKWGGLEHNTGDPLGYIGKNTSNDYATILQNTTIDSMVYNGPSRPTHFVYFRNTFSFKQLSLSFNIIGKFDYFFRRTGLTSSGLPWSGTMDFYKRWQKPGDELVTDVPSIQYPPVNTNRDLFYQNSSALIDKGDHIRLEDVSLGYNIDKTFWKGNPFSSLQLYCYINNVGILWRANHDNLDPDLSTNTIGVLPMPRTFSFGIKANF